MKEGLFASSDTMDGFMQESHRLNLDERRQVLDAANRVMQVDIAVDDALWNYPVACTDIF